MDDRLALVDTGCSTAVVRTKLAKNISGKCHMAAFDGRIVDCQGTSIVDLEVNGISLKINAVVLDDIVNNIDVVMGMEVIDQLGGVKIDKNGIQFGSNQPSQCLTAVVGKCRSPESGRPNHSESVCKIVDKDFDAMFDGKYWIVKWHWKGNVPPVLKNRISA